MNEAGEKGLPQQLMVQEMWTVSTVFLSQGIPNSNFINTREVKPNPIVLGDLALRSESVPEKQGNACRASAAHGNLVASHVNKTVVSGPIGAGLQSNMTSSTASYETPKLVNVHGFMVLADHALLVEDIYARYGDISSECKFLTPYVKTALMESVIRIVKLFQQHTSWSLSEQDSDFIRKSLHDLELAKFDVQWLKKRYNAAFVHSELAEDVKTYERLCRMISKTELVLDKLKADRELVLTHMNKRRRTLDMDVEKVLGADLL